MATRPLAVVVGSIGKLPLGGHTVFVSHHLAGLQELGYDVHYVERLASPDEAYDPRTNEILFEQAEQFFFGEGAQLPPDYRPPPSKG